MHYIHIMECYLATKKNEVWLCATTSKNLESGIIQSKEPIPKDHILYDKIYIKYPE